MVGRGKTRDSDGAIGSGVLARGMVGLGRVNEDAVAVIAGVSTGTEAGWNAESR